MRKLRFALLSVAFIALAIVAYALQAWSTLHQWLTGRRLTAKRSPRRPGAELEEKDFSGNEKGRQWCRPLRITLCVSG